MVEYIGQFVTAYREVLLADVHGAAAKFARKVSASPINRKARRLRMRSTPIFPVAAVGGSMTSRGRSSDVDD